MGIFATFGNTWKLIKISWQVLQKDRELILFPILSGIGVLLVVGLTAGVFAGVGTFDRLDSTENAQVNAGDIIVAALAYFVAFFVVIFFNAALIAAARERLKGGDPTVRSGLAVATRRLPAIIGWAFIAGTVGLILNMLRSQNRDSFLSQIIIGMVGGLWAYLTFFVIPVLVVEGVGPVEAIRRSGGLFKRTWGEQFVSNFGFGLLYIAVVLVAAIPVAILASVSPVAAIIVAIPVIGIGAGSVMAMEGIFKAALYEYAAEGIVPQYYTRESLAGAYLPSTRAYRGA